ncbi:MAG: hypothetical protein ACT4QG_15515 [Sporichthyaceae bacterium]
MDIKALKSQWDRVLAVVLTIAGAICLVAGILGVNDSVLLAEQTRYITAGGIGGIFLLGLGATLWISADLKDEWRKLDRIERALGEGVLRWSDGSEANVETARVSRRAKPATSDEATDVTANLAHAGSTHERG